MAKQKDPENITDTQKNRLFVNVPFQSSEDFATREKLEIMVKENGSDNAKFIRLLINQEWERREQVKRTIAEMKKRGVWNPE